MQGCRTADTGTIEVNNVSKNRIVGIININFYKTIKNHHNRSISTQKNAQPNQDKKKYAYNDKPADI
jgi:hypothetical protein